MLYETMLPSVLYVRDKWLKPVSIVIKFVVICLSLHWCLFFFMRLRSTVIDICDNAWLIVWISYEHGWDIVVANRVEYSLCVSPCFCRAVKCTQSVLCCTWPWEKLSGSQPMRKEPMTSGFPSIMCTIWTCLSWQIMLLPDTKVHFFLPCIELLVWIFVLAIFF